jgi:hypothetical protein
LHDFVKSFRADSLAAAVVVCSSTFRLPQQFPDIDIVACESQIERPQESVIVIRVALSPWMAV